MRRPSAPSLLTLGAALAWGLIEWFALYRARYLAAPRGHAVKASAGLLRHGIPE
jgi:hypothetical protein